MTAVELLSVAACDECRYAQAFPACGSERTEALVLACVTECPVGAVELDPEAT